MTGRERHPGATPEQRIAAAQAEIARRKIRSRAEETSQKIICGSLIISAALEQENARKYLIAKLQTVSRTADVKRIAPLLARLQNIDAAVPEPSVMGPRPSGQFARKSST